MDLSGTLSEPMQAFVDHFEKGIGELRDFLEENLVWTDWMAPGDDYQGIERFMEEFIDPIGVSFPDMTFDVTQLVAADNLLLVCGFFNGTFEQDYWGFPAHGRRVRWEARDIWRFSDNGRIDRIWFANNTLDVARELGADINDPRLW